ncbi:hypothetical protein IGJ76_000311 [Enterococcus sp. DIV0175]
MLWSYTVLNRYKDYFWHKSEGNARDCEILLITLSFFATKTHDS